jgi:hypothetical protein
VLCFIDRSGPRRGGFAAVVHCREQEAYVRDRLAWGGRPVFHVIWQIPEDEWFWQEGPDTVYWLSIEAIYDDGPPEQFVWGWKTREHYFNDDAVRIFKPTAPVPGDVFDSGEPIYDNAGTSWDMAFELTTKECMDPSNPDYSLWVAAGYPMCWCYDCFKQGDATGDCLLTFSDVSVVIAAWPPNPYYPCADFTMDGLITFSDVSVIIAHWPPNPGCDASCVPGP